MHLSALHVFPVKSCAALVLDEAQVEPRGLAHDRRWMVVDQNGTLVSARELRTLFHVVADTPETGDPVDGLRLSAPGLDPIEVAEPTSRPDSGSSSQTPLACAPKASWPASETIRVTSSTQATAARSATTRSTS